jgi:2-aminoadipate transaminase
MSVLPEAGTVSLARGIPAPSMLPVEALAEAARRAAEHHGGIAFNYGDPAGFAPLREWIAERHGVTPSRVVVTPGSLVVLHLLVRRLLPHRGRAIVEAPTYDRMLHLLRAAKADIATVDRTDEGLDVDALRDLLERGPRADFLYVLPTFHNPTGRTLSRQAREQLADLVIERRLTVIEDDAYGLLRLDGEPQPSLHTLLAERGGSELAVFMSSFSKSVAPGLRVGYAVVPDHLAEPLTALALSLYVSPPLFAQAQLFEFLASGRLDAHLEAVRELLRARRDALHDVLTSRLAGEARWTRPEGGYFLWLELLGPLDAATLAARARAAGVTFVPGAGFFAASGGERSARLSFSHPSVPEVRWAAERLAAAIAAAPVSG